MPGVHVYPSSYLGQINKIYIEFYSFFFMDLSVVHSRRACIGDKFNRIIKDGATVFPIYHVAKFLKYIFLKTKI